MSGQNRFRSLQDHAKKDCKFKQGVFYNSIYKISQTSKEIVLGQPVFDSTKNGFCTALSVDWISEQLCPRTPAQFTRQKGSALSLEAQSHAATQMELQHKIYTEHAKVDFRERVRAFAEVHGLRLELGGSECSLSEHMQDALGLESDVGFIVLQDLEKSGVKLMVDGNGMGHTVAIAGGNGKVSFFDANIGGYVIEKGNIDKFCKTYEDLVLSVFGYTLAKQNSYVVCDAKKPRPKVEF
jgi:hypothetical protein